MPLSPRTHSFHSSPLVRLVAGLDVAAPAASRQTVAERLSRWLDWTDAIALSSALSGDPSAAVPSAPPDARALAEAVDRARAELTRAITTDAVFTAGEGDAAGAPARRRQHLAHQRALGARIATLRAEVRAALSARGPGFGRLAALDAVLEKALAVREDHLLGTVPGWLNKHFERVRAAPPAGASPGAEEGRLMQSALLAELDLRLQPVEGLIDALRGAAAKEATRQP